MIIEKELLELKRGKRYVLKYRLGSADTRDLKYFHDQCKDKGVHIIFLPVRDMNCVELMMGVIKEEKDGSDNHNDCR